MNSVIEKSPGKLSAVRTSLSRIRVLARHEMRVTLTDPSALALLAIVPLVAMAFAKPLFGVFLQHQGFKNANGSEQVVPGFAILFALYLPAYIATSFIREHGLYTWVRLRATELRLAETVAGKLLVWIAVGIFQQATLFLGGWALLGLHVSGSLTGLSLISLLLVINMGALGIVLLALSRTTNQVWALGSTGSLVLAGLGGAIVPVASLPRWAADISPGAPSYWAMRGFRSVILRPGNIRSVFLPLIVLSLFTIAFLLFGLLRLRFDEPKEY